MDTIKFDEIASKYSNEESARELLEAMRWPNGPVCPHCGSVKTYKLTAKPGAKTPVRPGVYKCADCRKQFSVTVGTIFEDTHIPLHKWLMAIYLMCASKKGISAHQIHRMTGVTYKSAWFMCHRIRYAMTQAPLSEMLDGVVEVDETYVGGKPRGPKGHHKVSKKTPVLALVQRNGTARAMVVKDIDRKTVFDVINKHVSPDAHLITDGSPLYERIEKDYPTHSVIDHNKGEYVNGIIHTNTVEGWFALLKRGIMGTFHHVSEQHLHRYVGEFEFRYDHRKSNDGERAIRAIMNAKGKRLTYRKPTGADLTAGESSL